MEEIKIHRRISQEEFDREQKAKKRQAEKERIEVVRYEDPVTQFLRELMAGALRPPPPEIPHDENFITGFFKELKIRRSARTSELISKMELERSQALKAKVALVNEAAQATMNIVNFSEKLRLENAKLSLENAKLRMEIERDALEMKQIRKALKAAKNGA